MVHILTMVDVLESEAYQRNLDELDPVMATLWDLGMDISKPIEVSSVTCRSTINKKVAYCDRFVGELRDDKRWHDIIYHAKCRWSIRGNY